MFKSLFAKQTHRCSVEANISTRATIQSSEFQFGCTQEPANDMAVSFAMSSFVFFFNLHSALNFDKRPTKSIISRLHEICFSFFFSRLQMSVPDLRRVCIWATVAIALITFTHKNEMWNVSSRRRWHNSTAAATTAAVALSTNEMEHLRGKYECVNKH